MCTTTATPLTTGWLAVYLWTNVKIINLLCVLIVELIAVSSQRRAPGSDSHSSSCIAPLCVNQGTDAHRGLCADCYAVLVNTNTSPLHHHSAIDGSSHFLCWFTFSGILRNFDDDDYIISVVQCWFSCTLCRSSDTFEELLFIRSTPPSRPNKVGLKCPSVRPSAKSFFDFN